MKEVHEIQKHQIGKACRLCIKDGVAHKQLQSIPIIISQLSPDDDSRNTKLRQTK